MRTVLLLFLSLLLCSCYVQTLYEQEPTVSREQVLGAEISVLACNSFLFIPQTDLGPEAICINIFTREHSEEFGVDLSASSIAFDDEPTQQLLELLPVNNRSSKSSLLDAEIRRGHIARYSVARDGIPRVIILFPENAIQSRGEQLEVSPMGTRLVKLNLMFTYGEQRQSDQRSFNITSRKQVYTIFDL